MAGAMVGETFHTIIAEQFRRLRDGDRYWFESAPYFLASTDLLAEVRATTLSHVIRPNAHVGDESPDSVFGGPPAASSLPVSVEEDAAPAADGSVGEDESPAGASLEGAGAFLSGALLS